MPTRLASLGPSVPRSPGPFLLLLLLLSNSPAFAQGLADARQHLIAGQYHECIDITAKAIDDGAYGDEWRLLHVQALMAVGQFEQADFAMEAALRRYPSSVRLLMLSHDLARQLGDPTTPLVRLARINDLATRQPFFYQDPPDLVTLGRAALAMGGEPRLVLEQYFDRARKLDPGYRESYIATGRLALEKHDAALAAKTFAEGLAKLPDDPDLHYGLAEAFFDSDRGAALDALNAAMKHNHRHVPALLLRAEHLIDAESYDEAQLMLNEALAIDPGRPEAWAFKAVIAHLENDPVGEATCRAMGLHRHPTNPKVDHLIGLKLAQKYRFAESAALQRRALTFDPDYLPARRQLAQDLLRLGEEEQGWLLNDAVQKADPYDVLAYNQANLRDHMSKYATLSDGVFVVRMDKREADVYGRDVLELLHAARKSLGDKYEVELNFPVTVEIFADQRDFAVRTFGMPGGAGYLGVCFGKVVTMNSPATATARTSNWRSVLWHEYCHVVTLSKTHNRMPRWLSEGISVYEEKQADPTWGQSMDPTFQRMILDGELTPVSDMSAAFLAPRSGLHLQFAYFQSSLIVEYLIQEYGLAKLRAILDDLAAGTEINDAIERHADPLELIEVDFTLFAQERAESLAPKLDFEPLEEGSTPRDIEGLTSWVSSHPDGYYGRMALAGRLIEAGRFAEAVPHLQHVIDRYPQQAGESSAYAMLAAAHRGLNDAMAERAALQQLAERSHDVPGAYLRLMELAAAAGDEEAVLLNAKRMLAVNPLVPTPHEQIARIAEARGDHPQAAAALGVLLALDPINPADIHYRLAVQLHHLGDPRARRQLLMALEHAPRSRDAHQLLLRLPAAPPPPTPTPAAPPVTPTEAAP